MVGGGGIGWDLMFSLALRSPAPQLRTTIMSIICVAARGGRRSSEDGTELQEFGSPLHASTRFRSADSSSISSPDSPPESTPDTSRPPS